MFYCMVACVLVSLQHGVMGWSVIVVFSGPSHLFVDALTLCVLVAFKYSPFFGCIG